MKKPKAKKMYRVTYDYSVRVRVDVEASSPEEAESLGMREADEDASRNLTLVDVSAEELPQ